MREAATVTIRGVIHRTRIEGHGPPLVLLHGGPGLWDYLGPVAGQIASRVTVHRYDQRGAGGSERRPPYDLDTLIADLEALRTQWGHPGWIVAGHSWGADLALAYALRHPAHVRALVCISGTGPAPARWRPEFRRRFAQAATRLAADIDDPIQRYAVEFAHTSTPHRYAERFLADAPEGAPINLEANRIGFESWLQWLAAGGLEPAGSFGRPTLVVHGSEDLRPLELTSALTAELLPGARLAVLRGQGHLPWIEDPGPLEAELEAFLRAVR